MGKFRKFLAGAASSPKPIGLYGGTYHTIWADLVDERRDVPEKDITNKKKNDVTLPTPNDVKQGNPSTHLTASQIEDRIAQVDVQFPQEIQVQVERPRKCDLQPLEASPNQIETQKQLEDASPIQRRNAVVDSVDGIPLFGRQFRVAETSIIHEKGANQVTVDSKTTKVESHKMFQQVADANTNELPGDDWMMPGKLNFELLSPKAPGLHIDTAACIICLESFSGDVRAPETISIACQHKPSVCYGCLAKSIKNDLESKSWDEIRCPECQALFIHDDVRQFADAKTYDRYDRLSFRHAVGADENFIWCLNCNFGQLHGKGASQPKVRCLNCSAVSCFKHSIKWHDGLTCDQYDAVLWDPDSDKVVTECVADKRSKRTRDQDHAKELKREKDRQHQLHEIQKKAKREQQEKAAATKKICKERLEMMKRKMREMELSMQ